MLPLAFFGGLAAVAFAGSAEVTGEGGLAGTAGSLAGGAAEELPATLVPCLDSRKEQDSTPFPKERDVLQDLLLHFEVHFLLKRLLQPPRPVCLVDVERASPVAAEVARGRELDRRCRLGRLWVSQLGRRGLKTTLALASACSSAGAGL